MVVARRKVLEREMKRQKLSRMQLAERCRCHLHTIQNVLRGAPVGEPTQTRIYVALGEAVPMDKLFQVVPNPKATQKLRR